MCTTAIRACSVVSQLCISPSRFRTTVSQSSRTDICTTQTVLVLQSRSRYHRVDIGTPQSILVLHTRSWYYRVGCGSIESILVLKSRPWYYTVGLGTTESTPAPYWRSLHDRFDIGIVQSTLVLQRVGGPRVGGSTGWWVCGLVCPRLDGSACWWARVLAGPRVENLRFLGDSETLKSLKNYPNLMILYLKIKNRSVRSIRCLPGGSIAGTLVQTFYFL